MRTGSANAKALTKGSQKGLLLFIPQQKGLPREGEGTQDMHCISYQTWSVGELGFPTTSRRPHPLTSLAPPTHILGSLEKPLFGSLCVGDGLLGGEGL